METNKKAISLIVLTITIIVLSILSTVIILLLNESNVISKSKEAVKTANLNQIKNLATVLWSEAYMSGTRTQAELERAVLEGLNKQKNIDLGGYVIKVTKEGVTVEEVTPNNGIEDKEETEEKEEIEYYSSLASAINDVNNDKIGEKADANENNAVVGVFVNENKPYIILIKDTTEAELISFNKDMDVNLNGYILTLTDENGIEITNGNIKIDGSIEGSTIRGENIFKATAGQLIINGGTYISNSTSYVVAFNVLSKMTISDADVQTTSSERTAVGVRVQNRGNVTISNCKIISNGQTYSVGIEDYGYNTSFFVAESDIESNAVNGTAYGVRSKSNLEMSNCAVKASANYSADYSQVSIGIKLESGLATLNNCHVMGTHSGVSTSGELKVDGGIYEGYGHGGFYFSGTNTTSYVKNANIRQCAMPSGFQDLGAACNGAAFYIGGNTGKDNIKVYMDNCEMYGSAYPIVLRGSSGEKNNTLYISNSNVKRKNLAVRIDNDTHKLYIGTGCDFTANDSNRPTAVVQTNEVYVQ
ncbi:MAG: hypothetical protein IKV94_01190 [Clostridia bacterium]|nr:hypothetical protein [Clostridia bacterium]